MDMIGDIISKTVVGGTVGIFALALYYLLVECIHSGRKRGASRVETHLATILGLIVSYALGSYILSIM